MTGPSVEAAAEVLAHDATAASASREVEHAAHGPTISTLKPWTLPAYGCTASGTSMLPGSLMLGTATGPPLPMLAPLESVSVRLSEPPAHAGSLIPPIVA